MRPGRICRHVYSRQPWRGQTSPFFSMRAVSTLCAKVVDFVSHPFFVLNLRATRSNLLARVGFQSCLSKTPNRWVRKFSCDYFTKGCFQWVPVSKKWFHPGEIILIILPSAPWLAVRRAGDIQRFERECSKSSCSTGLSIFQYRFMAQWIAGRFRFRPRLRELLGHATRSSRHCPRAPFHGPVPISFFLSQ